MSCNKTSNNKYFNCPALMSDGRIMTDYRPSSYVNDLIRVNNGTYSSYNYRQFLMRNANELMEANNTYVQSKNECDQKMVDIPTEGTCIYNRNFGLCYPNMCDGIGQNNYATPEQKLLPYNIGKQELTPYDLNKN